MPPLDPRALAGELIAARSGGQPVLSPPTARDATFDLPAAYAVETEIERARRASGRVTVGRKVGFANRALWRVFKLETLVWAPMYDDTVRYAEDDEARMSMARMVSPKIEPEVVFRMREPLGDTAADAADVLGAVEWLALGFEIIDCPFPDWTFQAADFVAAFGFHAALVVGTPLRIEPAAIRALADALPRFRVKLVKDGELIEEGSGKNSLRSPALCLKELAAAISRTTAAEPLGAGELVSSGTLTESQAIAPGDTWQAVVEGIGLKPLTLRVDAPTRA